MTHYHVNGRNGLETYNDPEVAKGSADIWQRLGVGCTAFPCDCADNSGYHTEGEKS